MRHMQEVEVTLRDFSIEPEEIHVKAHLPVRFVVRNEGMMDHEFAVEGVPGLVEVDNVPPGQARTLEHTFHQPGIFETVCHYPGHEELGMEGKLVVE